MELQTAQEFVSHCKEFGEGNDNPLHRCPSVDEWIMQLWYIHTMQYYSAIKRNTFESALMRWMNLDPITQSEVSQKEEEKYHILD